MTANIDIRRASTRFVTVLDWLDSKHSFSFGPHRDPDNVGHGLLLVSNDDRVRAGTGFGTHGHRDMEIVTWVLAGQLEHKDSEGNHGLLYPGLAQRMSAGSGIQHSEFNPSPGEDVHFVQMRVPPDTTGIKPGYQQMDVNEQLAGGGLVSIASGKGHPDAIHIHQGQAVLWGARLGPGDEIAVPNDVHVHVFVPIGSASMGQFGELFTGDAARLTDGPAVTLTGGDEGAEVLIWATA
jgi:quercetin 2,3-dioxygenase